MPISRCDISLVLSIATFCVPLVAGAQVPSDTSTRTVSGPPAWLSLGVGGGNSRAGGLAARAAASIGVNPVLVFTLAATGVGSFDRTIDSINLMAGVRAPTAAGFLFASTGFANTSCGSGCPNRTGIAFDGGYHAGGRHAGIGLSGFLVRAPGGSNSAGVVLGLDVGWLGQRGNSTNRNR